MRIPRTSRVVAAVLLALAAATARADVLVLKDGTKLDGKVLREDGESIWVKTLVETRKIALAEVESRTKGVSAPETYDQLRAAAEKNPTSLADLWALWQFCTEHASEAGLDKEAAKLVPRLLKLDPDNAAVREANGEVKFEGKWVKKEDLERLKAEAAREAKRREWEKKLGVTVQVYDGEHWILVDNTASKDAAKRVRDLDDAYNKMCEILGVEKFWDGQGVAIAFKRYDDYAAYLETFQKTAKMPEWKYQAAKHQANGGFWRHEPAPFLMRCIPQTGEEGMWHALVHSAAHATLWTRYAGKEPMTWLDEGLASKVEIDVLGGQLSFCVGITDADKHKTSDKPKKKKGGASLSDAANEYKEKCIEAITNSEFPEMRKYLRMKFGEYGPAEEGGALGLVTWLLSKDAELFKKLVVMLRTPGKKDDDVWNQVYQWPLIEDWEKEWKAWALSSW